MRVDPRVDEKDLAHSPLALMFLAGLVTGLGQLLASEEKLTWRIITGRALSSAALGASAGTALILIPDMPLTASIGLACALASLGTSFLEKVVQRLLGIK